MITTYYVLQLLFSMFLDLFTATKTVYCINCIMFFVRSLSFYTASSYLGPKLVMIAKMVRKKYVLPKLTHCAHYCETLSF